MLTYNAIMRQIWGPYAEKNNQILRVNMANIRRKIERNPADPQYVFTEVGIGYRMREKSEGQCAGPPLYSPMEQNISQISSGVPRPLKRTSTPSGYSTLKLPLGVSVSPLSL